MVSASPYSMILVTCGSKDEAERLAEGLVRGRLAACVQILPITSFYEWKGEMNRDDELLLLVKTTAGRYGDVEAFIKANHSYEVPEIIQVPIERGLPDYLAWIDANTRREERSDGAD